MRRGFTLVELMVVAAIATVILLLAAPSFKSMIEMQRLRSVAAQFATDVQYARSEAPSRQRKVYLGIGEVPGPVPEAMSCYTIYTCPTTESCTCNCWLAENARCTGGAQELRTQQLLRASGVQIEFIATVPPSPTVPVPSFGSFDPVTGGFETVSRPMFMPEASQPDTAWVLTSLTREANAPSVRTEIGLSGRPTQCTPGGSVKALLAC